MSLRRAKDRLLARLLTRFPGLVRSWARGRSFAGGGGETPWTPFRGPLSSSRVALVTTGGVHLSSQSPFDMKDPDGDPTFREIPAGSPPAHLRITHDYYDHRDADRDINVILPLELLESLAAEGWIGGQAALHLGFMGHIEANRVERLVRDTAPRAARRLLESGADCVFLTPA